jgi:hypothetical protein
MTSEEYNNQYGIRFSFQHCIEILHQLPKFDPMIGGAIDREEGVDDDAEHAAVHDTNVAMASNLVRPVENKKAKTVGKRQQFFC